MDLGFVPIAGGAFIGEHSYDSENLPIATGRPDTQDLEKAKRFGESIREKIGQLHTLVDISPLEVPGDIPYKKWVPPEEMAPITVATLCTLCGECASVCPTAAITVEDAVMTDRKECILCSACVKKCPTLARKWDSPWIDQVTQWLSTNCRERKEPQIYL
jgi:ferredoxin